VDNNNSKTIILLWLLNPVLATIFLFKNFKQNTVIWPYLLVSVFFGLSFVISTTGGDSVRYAADLKEYHQMNISLAQVLDNAYAEGDSKLDIYQPLVTWGVSFFTDNTKVLFALFALVFGFFWFKSLIIIRAHIDIPLKGLASLAFVYIALTNPIWQINGMRMWTAVGAFFYGIILVHLQNQKKGWIFLVLPILIHFSLVISLVLYVIYRIFPKINMNILFGVFIFTFFLGELNLDFMRDSFKLLPSLIQSKEGYLGEEYVEILNEKAEDHAIHFILAGILSKYSVLIMAVLIYFNLAFKKVKPQKELSVFFSIALIFMSFSNLASSVPSGGRFMTLSNMILITTFLFFLNQKIKMNRNVKIILSFILLYVIVFKIRTGLDFVGLFFFIGNPIVIWFVEDGPIMEFIKSIL
jgi:hypothetical protein